MKTTANVGETESRHYRIWLTPIKKRQLNKASEVKSLGCQVTRTLEIQKQNLRKNQSHSRLFVGGSFLILGEMIKGTIHPPKTNDPTSPPKKGVMSQNEHVFQARFFQRTNCSHYQPAPTVGCPKLELRDQLIVISRTWKTCKHTWKD